MGEQTTEAPAAASGEDLADALFSALPSPELGPVIAEVRRLVEDHLVPKPIVFVDPITGDQAPGYLDKNGPQTLHSSAFDGYLTAPRFRTGTAVLTDADSLIHHVNRFKDKDSALFACDDRKRPSIEAVLDYHCSDFDLVDATGEVTARSRQRGDYRFGWHRSRFEFPLSDEWKAWTEADKNPFTMGEFAEFLEDRIIDVLDPPALDTLPEDLARYVAVCGGKIATPNKLVELSRGLKVNERSAVKEAINLASGEGQISFQSEHVNDAGERLDVPGLFLIGLPVFHKGAPYRLAARLRYRKTPGGVSFWFELWRADRTFDHAFREACDRVKAETGLPLLFGKPE